uniref:Uncharacterized protein n=1 Tax=Cyprinus carpio TaxID=7962 RepID=A0A8C1NVM9_CYPCA
TQNSCIIGAPALNNLLVSPEITLTEGSKSFATWKNPPTPVYMEFFIFNVTNPDEFLKGEAKPHVTTMGPYTYREYRPKHNVSFVHSGTKVAAYTKKIFVFEPEKSVGDPKIDLVTTVNIPAVVSVCVCVCVSFIFQLI